jgi:hypothetical protein
MANEPEPDRSIYSTRFPELSPSRDTSTRHHSQAGVLSVEISGQKQPEGVELSSSVCLLGSTLLTMTTSQTTQIRNGLPNVHQALPFTPLSCLVIRHRYQFVIHIVREVSRRTSTWGYNGGRSRVFSRVACVHTHHHIRQDCRQRAFVPQGHQLPRLSGNVTMQALYKYLLYLEMRTSRVPYSAGAFTGYTVFPITLPRDAVLYVAGSVSQLGITWIRSEVVFRVSGDPLC